MAVGLASSCAAEQFTLGDATVRPPSGWTEVKKSDERIVLRAPDEKQQATISIMPFGADASFADFKLICQHRLEAEKEASPDAFVQAEPPSEREGRFGMLYSGGEKQTGRVFSGYLSLAQRELLVIYVEGLGVGRDEHLETFQSLVKGLTQK